MALLSVIIPAYNAADTIDACLESVLASSGINSEIICVNDGSTDGTGEILQQWERQDNRIHCISQPNRGVAIARNVALEHASGQYVTFVDADDTIEPSFLPALCAAAESTGADCVVAGWVERGRVYQLTPSVVVYAPTAERAASLPNHGCARTYAASVLRRSEARFCPHLQMGEDTFFNYCVYPWCNKIALIPETGYQYRRDISGSLSSKGKELVLGMLDGADELAAYYERHGMLVQHRDVFLRFCVHTMNCVRALAPFSRQREAASRMRSLLLAVGMREEDAMQLPRKPAQLILSLLRGSDGLGFSFYKKRLVRMVHGR